MELPPVLRQPARLLTSRSPNPFHRTSRGSCGVSAPSRYVWQHTHLERAALLEPGVHGVPCTHDAIPPANSRPRAHTSTEIKHRR